MQEKLVALTFDDGPNTTATPKVLDRIEKYSVTATFFVNGCHFNDESVKVLKRAVDMGCEIQNHSQDHLHMDKISEQEVLEQVSKTDELIEKYAGKKATFFRPPFIDTNSQMFDLIDHTFICGFCPNDWDKNVTKEMTAKEVIANTKENDIILLHDSFYNEKSAFALDEIIPALLDKGFKFVTISELFEKRCKTIDHSKIYSNVN